MEPGNETGEWNLGMRLGGGAWERDWEWSLEMRLGMRLLPSMLGTIYPCSADTFNTSWSISVGSDTGQVCDSSPLPLPLTPSGVPQRSALSLPGDRRSSREVHPAGRRRPSLLLPIRRQVSSFGSAILSFMASIDCGGGPRITSR